jgi:hypothetical protein
VAVLQDTLSTKEARDGDRMTLTVRSPSQYAGATVEGYLERVARSGQVSGRAEMSFAFDRIRVRDGRVYNFAGEIESVRTTNDDTVRVDNEGRVQDEGSQTARTAERTGIGAAIGAVIGGGRRRWQRRGDRRRRRCGRRGRIGLHPRPKRSRVEEWDGIPYPRSHSSMRPIGVPGVFVSRDLDWRERRDSGSRAADLSTGKRNQRCLTFPWRRSVMIAPEMITHADQEAYAGR